MLELLEAISDFDAACEAGGLRYVIGGSVCSGIHSIIRNTNDVDIVIGRALSAKDPIFPFLQRSFIVDEIGIVQSHALGKCFNIFHESSAIKFDLFPPLGEFAKTEIKRGLTVKPPSSPRSFCIASVEDIIVAKLNWWKQSSSDRQEQDIIGLLSVNQGKIDQSYLDYWAKVFGTFELLESLSAKISRK